MSEESREKSLPATNLAAKAAHMEWAQRSAHLTLVHSVPAQHATEMRSQRESIISNVIDYAKQLAW
jgi:hypothetical protein